MARREAARQVLLVEDNLADAELVRRYFRQAGGDEFELTHTTTLSEAFAAVESIRFDVLLLDQFLPDGDSHGSFAPMYARISGVPIIVLTGLGDDASGIHLVQQGAQDFLVKGSFDASLLLRVVRYTLGRWQLLRENEKLRESETREREINAMNKLAAQAADERGIAAEPLRQTSPTLFANLVRRFDQMLDLALERRIYRQDSTPLKSAMQELAQDLAQVEAGPREIVDIYSTALQGKLGEQASKERGQAYVEEGRLVLLEAMGSLVKAYRGDGRRQRPQAQ